MVRTLHLVAALAGSLLFALLLPASLPAWSPPARGAVADRAVPEPGSPDSRFAGLARASPVAAWAALPRALGRTGDLWFRSEPARTRLALGLAGDPHQVLSAIEMRHSLSGSLDTAGWFLAFGSQIRLGGDNAAFAPRLVQQRLALGRSWQAAGLQITLQAGLSRIGLDALAMALTGRADRFGLVAAAQFWRDWPERGPAGLRFAQLALETDRAREGISAIARIGFALGTTGLAFGPEGIASAGERWRLGPLTYRHPYRHLRLGAHASGLRLGRASLTLSGGALLGSREKPRPYAAFGLSLAY